MAYNDFYTAGFEFTRRWIEPNPTYTPCFSYELCNVIVEVFLHNETDVYLHVYRSKCLCFFKYSNYPVLV